MQHTNYINTHLGYQPHYLLGQTNGRNHFSDLSLRQTDEFSAIHGSSILARHFWIEDRPRHLNRSFSLGSICQPVSTLHRIAESIFSDCSSNIVPRLPSPTGSTIISSGRNAREPGDELCVDEERSEKIDSAIL